MSRCSFRPVLETLEGRDLPSFLGIGLLNLNQQITTVNNNATSLNTKLTNAQKDLTTQINSLTAANLGTVIVNISNDYSMAGSLFGQIKQLASEFTTLQQVQQNFAFAAFTVGDGFDQILAFQALTGSSGLFGFGAGTSTMSATTTLGLANTTINMAEPPPFPSIATGANVGP
jgi:hypothetical protein